MIRLLQELSLVKTFVSTLQGLPVSPETNGIRVHPKNAPGRKSPSEKLPRHYSRVTA